MPEGVSNGTGGGNQPPVWDKLLDLTEKTAAAAGQLKIAIPIVAAALAGLFYMSYELNRNLGELGVTLGALDVTVGNLDVTVGNLGVTVDALGVTVNKLNKETTTSINSLVTGQKELNSTVGNLRTSVEDLKKKL